MDYSKKPLGFSNNNKELRKNIDSEEVLEQKALTLINQGNEQEAFIIYTNLISNGTKNHIVYGNLGVLHGKKGDTKKMASLLKKAIEINPSYLEAHYNLGNAYQIEGNLDMSIRYYKTALKINPNYHNAHYNLGNSLRKKGEISASIASYEKAVKINPNFAEAFINLGNSLKESNRNQYAIDSYKKALRINPSFLEAQINLGNTLLSEGDLEGAINSFKKAIKINSTHAETHYNLGTAFLKKANYESAIPSFKAAISLNPKLYKAYNNLGNAFKGLGHIDQAIISYKKAIKLSPNFAEALNNLGISFKLIDNIEESINSYRKALKFNPNYPEAYNNLGNVLQLKQNHEEAIICYQKALEINPRYAEAFNNLGTSQKQKGDLKEAIKSFQTALKINKNEPDAHWNLAITQLYCGNYKSGWENYEWRWKNIKAIKPHANPKINKWQGELLHANEKLLIVSEQGLGDTIQFMRYIQCLKEKKIDVSFCALKKLHGLIKESKIDDNPLSPEQGDEVSEGKWLPLLSLPKYLGVSEDDPIVNDPYILTNDYLNQKWKSLLQKEKKPIIGINWQGNPNAEQKDLKGRSLHLENFRSLDMNDNFKFLSLQKGFGSDQMKKCSFQDKFVQCQDEINEIWDFVETAAIITNCDLIITSDTALAHLAGGIGKTTWVLLRDIPEWRWGICGEKTIWYPNMRLFRQKERYNWKEVMNRVSIALLESGEIIDKV